MLLTHKVKSTVDKNAANFDRYQIMTHLCIIFFVSKFDDIFVVMKNDF